MSKHIAVVPRSFHSNGKTTRFIHQSYINLFQKYDCTLFMLTSFPHDTSIFSIFDALLLPGGLDIHPTHYGEISHPETVCYDDDTDEIELACIQYFYQNDKPILAICRGIQSLNVAFHGTLYQHIENHIQNKQDTFHKIIPHENSFLKESIEVNSFHHQSIKDIAPVFHIVSTSEDGCVEMIEYKNIIGVQWHPELMENDPVIPYFLTFLK